MIWRFRGEVFKSRHLSCVLDLRINNWWGNFSWRYMNDMRKIKWFDFLGSWLISAQLFCKTKCWIMNRSNKKVSRSIKKESKNLLNINYLHKKAFHKYFKFGLSATTFQFHILGITFLSLKIMSLYSTNTHSYTHILSVYGIPFK